MRRAEHARTWREPQLNGNPPPFAPARLDTYKLRRESLVHSAMEAISAETVEEMKLKVPLPDVIENRISLDMITPATSIDAQSAIPVGQGIVPPEVPAIECFDALKANLWIRFPERSMKVLLFAGAAKGSGVSTAAGNFAASLAQDSGVKVLLIDANVRSPKQLIFATANPIEGNAGGSLERLLGNASGWQDPTGSTNLYVLGAKCSSPLSAFRSDAFDEFLHKVRGFFDYVIIDAPLLASHPETLLLSQKADGVILVIESEKTRRQPALWAKKQIEMAGGRLLGVVLNKRRHRIPNWLYKRI
jgi:protein-tyrosine kinase